MDLQWEDTADGVKLGLQALPGSRQNRVIGLHDGRLKVAVTAAPEKGKANTAIIEFLAKTWQLRRRQLSIVAGQTSPLKQLLVADMTSTDLLRIIEDSLPMG